MNEFNPERGDPVVELHPDGYMYLGHVQSTQNSDADLTTSWGANRERCWYDAHGVANVTHYGVYSHIFWGEGKVARALERFCELVRSMTDEACEWEEIMPYYVMAARPGGVRFTIPGNPMHMHAHIRGVAMCTTEGYLEVFLMLGVRSPQFDVIDALRWTKKEGWSARERSTGRVLSSHVGEVELE